MNEQSECSSSIQINSQNNYKYDKYGFVLVNSIDDLLYDKFNEEDKREKKENFGKKSKKYNGNYYNSSRNYPNISSIVKTKNKIQDDKTVKIVLNINNKEKKAFKINPNDSQSLESISIQEKDSDTKNENKIKGVVDKKKKKNEGGTNHIQENSENDDDDEFTFCEEENENKKNTNEEKEKKKEKEEKEEKEEKDDVNETDINKKKPGPKNMKQIKKTRKKHYHYSQPVLTPCYMTKIRKMNRNVKEAIPKSNRTFITKTYENEKKEKEKEKNNKKLILTWPNSSICYFNRSKKIINVNIHIPLQNVTNKNYFCTKEKIDIDKYKLKRDSKSISNINKEPPDSSNIVIKIVNPDNSLYRYGKINIKTGSDKKANSNKSYVFKIKQNKNNLKHILFNNKDSLSHSKCLKNKEIIKALKKKRKTKSKKKKEISPECITLKRRKKFADKIYKKIMKKKALFYPPEYKISIKTKFKNNLLDNYRSIEAKKEEEKLMRNNSMNKYEHLNKNNNNIIYPSIRKMMYDENTKNKSISFIKDQKYNYNNNNFGQYYNFNNNGNYNYNYNYSNNSQNFPAINSYFH